MIHYLFENEIIFDKFCNNINTYLEKYGFLVITTFDGNLVH